MLLYAEFDQRSGWAVTKKIVDYFVKEGVAAGRTENAIQTLKSLKMLDEDTSDGEEKVRMSTYGVVWFEKNLPLVSRGDSYTYSLPMFRTIKLVGPDEFYGKTGKRSDTGREFDWTKWGTILAGVGIIVSIALWNLS